MSEDRFNEDFKFFVPCYRRGGNQLLNLGLLWIFKYSILF